mgnify:CR=1 FL=1
MPDAVETVEAAVDAAVLLFIRVLHSLHIKRTVRNKIGGTNMGNSTGSTMYMFGAVIVIYIVGMLLYQGFQWIKKKMEQKKDEEFRRGDK